MLEILGPSLLLDAGKHEAAHADRHDPELWLDPDCTCTGGTRALDTVVDSRSLSASALPPTRVRFLRVSLHILNLCCRSNEFPRGDWNGHSRYILFHCTEEIPSAPSSPPLGLFVLLATARTDKASVRAISVSCYTVVTRRPSAKRTSQISCFPSRHSATNICGCGTVISDNVSRARTTVCSRYCTSCRNCFLLHCLSGLHSVSIVRDVGMPADWDCMNKIPMQDRSHTRYLNPPLLLCILHKQFPVSKAHLNLNPKTRLREASYANR
ncbi:hypothetical protein F4820DRAFT_243527 [Hypoxylon rubiginosum]|uniref:Uncharacterized protein n=1 Tax=Hypoxylon rubiginosum TaxID=110542 RepID=A0ACB9Z5J8_9PEZI|nr:hypothetical protein F4820DRAFT_243527 [Hypoxylon rubiginosum]